MEHLVQQKYQILFTQKQQSDRSVTTNKRKSTRRYTQLNIVAMNYYLWSKENKVFNSEYKNNPWKPDLVMSKWTLEGIVATEEGHEQTNQFTYPSDFGKEVLNNCAIRGRTTTYNIWGKNAKPGTKLFLILKRVQLPLDTTYVINPVVGGKNIEFQKTEKLDAPLQFVPFAHYDYDWPSDDDITYVDLDGRRVRGLVIYIGKVESNVGSVNNYTQQNVINNINSVVTQPTMLIHLDNTF